MPEPTEIKITHQGTNGGPFTIGFTVGPDSKYDETLDILSRISRDTVDYIFKVGAYSEDWQKDA